MLLVQSLLGDYFLPTKILVTPYEYNVLEFKCTSFWGIMSFVCTDSSCLLHELITTSYSLNNTMKRVQVLLQVRKSMCLLANICDICWCIVCTVASRQVCVLACSLLPYKTWAEGEPWMGTQQIRHKTLQCNRLDKNKQ